MLITNNELQLYSKSAVLKRESAAQVGDYFLLPRDAKTVVLIQNGLHAGNLFSTDHTYQFSNAYGGKSFIVVQAGPASAFGNYANKAPRNSNEEHNDAAESWSRRLVLLPFEDEKRIQVQGPVCMIDQDTKNHRVRLVVRRFADDSAEHKVVSSEFNEAKLNLLGNRRDLAEAVSGTLHNIIEATKATRAVAERALEAELIKATAGTKQCLVENGMLDDVEIESVINSVISTLRHRLTDAEWKKPLLPKLIRQPELPLLGP